MDTEMMGWCGGIHVQHRRGRFGRWICAAAAALAFGCGADGQDRTSQADGLELDDTPESAESSATGETQQALGDFSGESSWVQGQPSADIGSATTQFCWLTQVQGDFEGGGERVRIYVSDGRWRLGGASLQEGGAVGAKARCSGLNSAGRTLSLSSEGVWRKGDPKKRLADDDGFTACVLTRVEGKFEGSGEVVEITRSGGAWFLGGTSAQPALVAGARCIGNVFAYSGNPTITRTCGITGRECPFDDFPEACSTTIGCDGPPPIDLGTVFAPPAIWGPNVFSVCGLGRITGKYQGGGEFASITKTNGTSGHWFLDTGGAQRSVFSASAYCFL